ncbi:hypothetical protein P2318_18645 [Myxococcaceae bacterium GXIMD 01537]
MRTSTVVRGLGALAAALVIQGCATTSRVEAERSAAPSSVGAYYPLAVGNRWTYLVNGRGDKPVNVEITGQADGYFQDTQGGNLQLDGFGVRDVKRYLLRGPIEVGHSWTNIVSVSSTERYQIVQAGVSCEVPAGVFQDCVRVEGRNRVDQETTIVGAWTYAAGVGLVRMEMFAERQGKRIPQTWLELKSYQVKQPPRG